MNVLIMGEEGELHVAQCKAGISLAAPGRNDVKLVADIKTLIERLKNGQGLAMVPMEKLDRKTALTLITEAQKCRRTPYLVFVFQSSRQERRARRYATVANVFAVGCADATAMSEELNRRYESSPGVSGEVVADARP